ncbi:MAG: hypothetical protein H0V98_03875 [Chloroflexia bacterium]|nr:hypothetical protein [Chloroflexia bacterium]
MDNPFSWDYLTAGPNPGETFGALSITLLLVCIVGLFLAVALYNRPAVLSSRQLLRRTTSRTWASVFIWIFMVGLFFFVVRWLQINPFSFGERIWQLLTLMAALIAAAMMLWQIRTTAPLLASEAAQAHQDRARGVAGRRPPKRSSTRKR